MVFNFVSAYTCAGCLLLSERGEVAWLVDMRVVNDNLKRCLLTDGFDRTPEWNAVFAEQTP